MDPLVNPDDEFDEEDSQFMEFNSYKSQLWDLFADNLPETVIDDAIWAVLSKRVGVGSSPTRISRDQDLQEMTIHLLDPHASASASSSMHPNNLSHGAHTINATLNGHLGYLRELFPSISEKYLREFCGKYTKFDLDRVIEDLSEIDYEKEEKDPLLVWEQLKQMLPDADPIFLRNKAKDLVNQPEVLREFVNDVIVTKDYPTMQDYLSKKEHTEKIQMYTTNFSVGRYLAIVPNPWKLFASPTYATLLVEPCENVSNVLYARLYFYDRFPFLRCLLIDKVFENYKYDLYRTYNRLKQIPKSFRNPRGACEFRGPDGVAVTCDNVEVLQILAFFTHENRIKHFIKQKNDRYRQNLEEARKFGLLETCKCCFDDEVIPEECYYCNKNCSFCKDCVQKGAEVAIGDGQTTFPCLGQCDSEFSYNILQMILDKKTFERMWQRKQSDDIKKANIDGLENCPFCDFSMIPRVGDKIFKCANVECLKESCRECWHPAHLPLRCSEIEYDEDVKRRTYIENKMAEAILRKCNNCGKSIVKESGCNKITCVCGHKMCYLCGKSIQDYSHFGGLCPLNVADLGLYHMTKVLEAAKTAKDELGVETVKFDPSANILQSDIA